MKVLFVMQNSDSGYFPSGGAKIVYEYANRLSELGYQVYLQFCYDLPHSVFRTATPWNRYRFFFSTIIKNYLKNILGKRLFRLFPQVHEQPVMRLDEKKLAEFDKIIVTAWRTAAAVAETNLDTKKIFYLIQGYEIWNGNEAAVAATYNYGFKNIVVSSWLTEKIAKYGAKAFGCIPNPIDPKLFFVETPYADRGQKLAMVYSGERIKACTVGLAAIDIVKELFPDLQAHIFGGDPRPKELPAWIEYTCKPSPSAIRAIYNSARVFVSSSKSEGFGLPGAEAIACGCALASTDSGGVREYARPDVTALLSSPDDVQALARNITTLLKNEALANRLIAAGQALIAAELSWTKSIQKMIALLQD